MDHIIDLKIGLISFIKLGAGRLINLAIGQLVGSASKNNKKRQLKVWG